jgi:DNA-binding protein H-NS
MQVQILSQTDRSLRATCGKKTAFVYRATTGVWVTCENASHQVWRGGGRTFATWHEAQNGYKSPEMRAIIQLAQEQLMAAIV